MSVLNISEVVAFESRKVTAYKPSSMMSQRSMNGTIL